MNKKEIAIKVRDTLRKYKEQGSDSPCRRNHIVLNAGNMWEHEEMKCRLCHSILQGAVPYMQKEGLVKYSFKNPHSFITEAVDRRTGKRRDVVILETSQIIEVVNTHTSPELMSEYKRDDVLIIKV